MFTSVLGSDMSTGRPVLNACVSCSSQKRGCDRRLPVCSRCARDQTSCHYGNQETTYRSALPRRIAGSRIGSPHPWLRPLLQPPGCSEDLDAALTHYVFDTLDLFYSDPGTLIHRFELSVHQWMPIIDTVTLRIKAATVHSTPCAEIGGLLLFFVLVTQFEQPPYPGHPSPSPSLYDACKYLFFLLQTFRRDRLTTIQSGLLLAIYEQGSGFSLNAYHTLAACASLGYAMGLDQVSRGTSSPTVLQDEDLEEKRRVWWATYYLDRLHFYSDESSTRIYLTQDANVGDTPPSSNSIWPDATDSTTQSSLNTSSLSFDEESAMGGFTGQIQAMYALQCVLQSRKNCEVPSEELLASKTRMIDSLLQNRLQETLGKSTNNLEVQYTVVVIYLLALLELHKQRLVGLNSQDFQIPYSSARDRSLAALEVALNIVHDLVYIDQTGEILDPRKMPLVAVILLKKAGKMAIWLELQHHRSTVIPVLPAIIHALDRVNHVWKDKSPPSFVSLVIRFLEKHQLLLRDSIAIENRQNHKGDTECSQATVIT
ncbi:hypothetical protein BKA64DRAFT_131627 [Cadophora sp. MPI-SDFR-AT-0126]|nr:hypothetical protein BKA64DRAFT_131627 [Leotiomycetes sp. MPI-SDFR-AT-0126]